MVAYNNEMKLREKFFFHKKYIVWEKTFFLL